MSNHTHHHGCCCCHNEDENNTRGCTCKSLNETEKHFLQHLIEYHYLPIAQFVLKSTKEDDFESIVLSPVFIIDEKDTIEQVKNFGEKLKILEEKGFVNLDYDIPLKGYEYNEYYNSDLFAYFKQTVENAKGNDKFLGDIATMELGSIAPTQECLEMFNSSIAEN